MWLVVTFQGGDKRVNNDVEVEKQGMFRDSQNKMETTRKEEVRKKHRMVGGSQILEGSGYRAVELSFMLVLRENYVMESWIHSEELAGSLLGCTILLCK